MGGRWSASCCKAGERQLPTPPKCFAASVHATLHAAFARKVRARPSGCSTFEAIWVHLRYGPATRSPSFSDGFVNRLQDVQFPSFLLFKLRGLDSYPGGTFTHCSCQPSLDAHFSVLPYEQGRQRQHLVCRRKSEQLLSKDQVEGSRCKCSLPHEQRTSNTGTNVRPYGVSEYCTRRGKPCS
jgi:hypothetical protein